MSVLAEVAEATPSDAGAFVAHLVSSVDHGFMFARDEVFGWVATTATFPDKEDAIRMGDDYEYGLISNVFARDNGDG